MDHPKFSCAEIKSPTTKLYDVRRSYSSIDSEMAFKCRDGDVMDPFVVDSIIQVDGAYGIECSSKA